MNMNTTSESIDEYIINAPEGSREALRKTRALVQKIAPEAKQSINYGIPTFQMDPKRKFHFGGYDKHIGIYPTPPVVSAFADRLTSYTTAKGSIQLPLNEPIPYDLIEKLAKAALIDKT